MSRGSKSLSEKISEIINPNPVWEDPENEFSETTAKLVEKSDEFIEVTSVPISSRKISKCSLLDEDDKRYMGKKVSRRYYEKGSPKSTTFSSYEGVSSEHETTGSRSSSETSALEEIESGGEESDGESGGEESDGESGGEESDGESGGEESSEDDGKYYDVKSEDDSFRNFKSNDFKAEIEKANAVRSQIRVWDDLLEVRIQLQKCLVAANRLPPHNYFDSFKRSAGSEFHTELNQCKQGGLMLLSNLLELQNVLLSSNSEARSLSSGNTRKDDDEIPSGDESCSGLQEINEDSSSPKKKRKLSDISKEIADRDLNFRRYKEETLQKWYLRSKAASIKSSNFSAFDLSILKQIEHVLRDRNSLIKRTQKKRSSYRAFGVPLSGEEVGAPKADEEFDCEIYDDDDFYHKLLRELIERKSADLADPTRLGKQWSELQKLRRKLKKKVDTKASKGRKIRYVVHSKLINFMAPVPYVWNDSAMEDLFRSLFGKAE